MNMNLYFFLASYLVWLMVGTRGLVFKQPALLAGINVPYLPAQFSPKYPIEPEIANVKLAVPADACKAIDSITAQHLSNMFVVVVQSTNCTPQERSMNVAATGALGIIGVDLSTDLISSPASSGCYNSSIWYVVIGKTVGTYLMEYLTLGVPVVAEAVLPTCAFMDRTVMAALRDSLHESIWLEGGPNACAWKGVTCFADGTVGAVQDLDPLAQCENSDRAWTLPHGTLPNTLCSMKHLTLFEIYSSYVVGALPDFSNCTYLVSLQLRSGGISGTLPKSLFHAPSLAVLDLQNNKLSGTIPDVLSNSPLAYVRLNENNLSGSVPSSLASRNIMQLDVSHNTYLGGPIPAVLFANVMDLDITNTSVTLPAQLATTQPIPLQILNLGYTPQNMFPPWLPQATLLEVLHMDGCNLTTSNVYSLVGLSIVELGLSSNSLEGLWTDFSVRLPAFYKPITLGGTTSRGTLQRLYLSGNFLSGEIAPENLPSTVDLSYNMLSVVKAQVSNTPYSSVTVNLQGNLITHVDLTILQSTADFTMDLRGNPIQVYDGPTPVPILDGQTTVNLTDATQCPTHQAFAGTNIVAQLDPLAYNYQQCTCLGGYRQQANMSRLVCEPCGDGLLCPGRGVVVVMRGLYPSPGADNPDVMLTCPFEGDVEICNPDQLPTFECRYGHFGRKCGGCIDGYGHAGYLCVLCEYNILALAGMCVFIAILLSYILLFRGPPRRRSFTENKESNRFTYFISPGVSLLITWAQYMSVVLHAYQFPSMLSPVRAVLSFTQTTLGTVADCVMTPANSFYVSAFSPFIVGGLAVMTYGWRSYKRDPDAKFLSVSSFFYLLNIIYLPVTYDALSFVACEYDDGMGAYYYIRYPEAVCGSYVPIGGPIIVLIFFTFGLVFAEAVVLWVLHNTGRLEDTSVALSVGHWYLCYKKSFYFVHPVSLLLRILITASLTVRGVGTSIAVVVLSLWVAFLGIGQPYAANHLNYLELIFFGSVMCIQTLGLVSEAQSNREDVTGFVLAILGIVLCSAVSIVVYDHRRSKSELNFVSRTDSVKSVLAPPSITNLLGISTASDIHDGALTDPVPDTTATALGDDDVRDDS